MVEAGKTGQKKKDRPTQVGCTCHDWKIKVDRKNKRPSQTPGKMKGENCKCTILDRYMAKTNRSYKHPEYASWCAKMVNKRKLYGG
uniref:Uncharacterized protein n=1 Tax=viral metagenome TaxID=1070528 RepID=A0A6M3LIZ9_9ZZZZ